MKNLKLFISKWSCALALAAGGLSVAACQEEQSESQGVPGAEGNGRRTVLVYMNARNSLYGNVKPDSLELAIGARRMNPRDRMLLFVCKDKNTYLYRVSAQGTKLLLQGDSTQNASDPKLLESVLRWTGQQFPSEEYGLVMWSHSDGWLPSTTVTSNKGRGFGVDVGANGNPWTDRLPNGDLGYQMDITDMAAAIQASGVHPKFVFFDSCLMNGVEAMYDLRQVTDWIIASPAQIPGVGAQYTEMMDKVLYTVPFQPAVFTEAYVHQATVYPEYGKMGVVLSAVQTDKLEELARVTRTLLQRYYQNVEPNMDGVLAYDRYEYRSFFRPECFDLKQAMRQIITDDADWQTWVQALEACVQFPNATPSINMWSNKVQDNVYLKKGEFSAISAFIPQQKYSDNTEYCIFGDLNKRFAETEWAQASGWTEHPYLKQSIQP